MSGPIPSPNAPSVCPSCRQPASGKFCSNCGTPIGHVECGTCRAELDAAARFCHRCGTQVRPGRSRQTERTAWIIAALVVVFGLGFLIYRVVGSSPAAPVVANMANAGNASGATPIAGPAPDISKMSAKERFSRLNDRVMQAMERGDTTFVLNFTPMALGAYSQLDSVSADERYHAAMIHAQIGEFKEALALADTILANHPNHLFGYLVRATVSEFQGDSARARESRARFLAAYDAELKRELPEYIDHKPILEGFRASAMTQLPAGQR